MSILNYFRKEHSLPTSESTGLSKKTVEEVNKYVSKTLEHKGGAAELDVSAKLPNIPMRQEQSWEVRCCPRISSSAETFQEKELGDLPESTRRKYKTLYTKELAVRDNYFELAVNDILKIA